MGLLNAIRSGEGKLIEFKEVLPGGQAIAKTGVRVGMCLLEI